LGILPQQKIYKFPVQIKIEENETKAEEFGCQICNKNYSTKSSFLRHVMEINEKPGIFKCEICKFSLKTKDSLTRHQKTHIKNCPRPFKCSKCDFAAHRKSDLKKHFKSYERIIERCDKCNTILVKHKIHDCRLDCKYCGKIFSHSATVINHIKNLHAQETERTFYDCNICGLKVTHRIYLMKHMDAKHVKEDIQILTCDFDGKTFKEKKALVAHMKSHFSSVKCDFCHLKVNASYLKLHIINSYTGIKPPKSSVEEKP